jgi:hypothetical protein
MNTFGPDTQSSKLHNEKLDELQAKAAEWASKYCDARDGDNPEDQKHDGYFTEFGRKFAELIIKECIEKITTYDLVPGHSAKWEDIYDIHARLLQDLGEDLKQHFGVDK